MRYLILGAGALGGYFGGRLLKGGADVTFLVRPGRAAQLARDGLVVRAQDGEIRTGVKTLLKGEIEGPYDVVLLACKAYDLDGAIDAIAPAMGDQSVILPLLNGVGHIAALGERFGEGRVVGGLTFINAALAADGSIQQSALKVNTTAIGELDRRISPRCREIANALGAGGLPTSVSDDITGLMWNKLFGFACSATIATSTRTRAGSIARTAIGRAFVADVIEECTRIVAAEGFPPPTNVVGILLGVFSAADSTYCPSMLVDMEQGRPTEGGHTIGDLVSRAARRGIPAPILGAALCNLQAYEIDRVVGGTHASV
jgi:2-dehydropantoate 2-reductase